MENIHLHVCLFNLFNDVIKYFRMPAIMTSALSPPRAQVLNRGEIVRFARNSKLHKLMAL